MPVTCERCIYLGDQAGRLWCTEQQEPAELAEAFCDEEVTLADVLVVHNPIVKARGGRVDSGGARR